MFLSSAQRQSQLQDNAPTIRIGDDQIQLSNREKLLGVIVDTSLNWSAQVEATLKKVQLSVTSTLQSRKVGYNMVVPSLDPKFFPPECPIFPPTCV